MENFRQQFLFETVNTLKNLLNDLQSAETISNSQKREIFRTLHTVKGTAQTFGFKSSSRLAHQLESLLSLPESFSDINQRSVLYEGIELLIESLEQKNFRTPDAFAKKLRISDSNQIAPKTASDSFSNDIPNEFLSQLSVQEKNVLRSAQQNEKTLFCLEVGFELTDFAEGLINFRGILSESGEIIATLPSAKFSRDGKIGFQILFASSVRTSQIESVAEESAAEIIFDSTKDTFSNDALGIISQAVKHAEETAKKLDKQIRFETSVDEVNVLPGKLKIIFEALLHLVRNAVDHAIETTGTIKINLTKDKNNLHLTVSDDGRGIDLNDVKTKAIKKNLISADKILTEQETLDLIFLPELSTKSSITEISGRGVGLDAVKSSVEKAGGKIIVASRSGAGTTFDIFLPQ